MGAYKTAVLIIGVAAAVFHLVSSSSPQPVPSSITATSSSEAPNTHVVMTKRVHKVVEEESQEEEKEEEKEEERKRMPMSSFEKLVLSTETARQKAALAAALAQEYRNGESIVSNKYSEYLKMAEGKNSSADEYEEWSDQLEEAAAELLLEEEERLNLAEKIDKHANDYARLSRRSRKDSRDRALNASMLEFSARSCRALATDLFARAKLKHERAEDYIERARDEDRMAIELQRQAMELSKLAEEHRTKASNTAARAQQLEDSAYEDEVSAVKHEKEASSLERKAEEARASDRESTLVAIEYLIRRIEKQCKGKRLRVGARNLHALAEVYSSEARTLRGIARRDIKDKDFYMEKALQEAKHTLLYRKTIQGLLSVFRNHMQMFKQRLKETIKVAAENGYEYAVMRSPRFEDEDQDIDSE